MLRYAIYPLRYASRFDASEPLLIGHVLDQVYLSRISPVDLAYILNISPISPPYLPYISRISPVLIGHALDQVFGPNARTLSGGAGMLLSRAALARFG